MRRLAEPSAARSSAVSNIGPILSLSQDSRDTAMTNRPALNNTMPSQRIPTTPRCTIDDRGPGAAPYGRPIATGKQGCGASFAHSAVAAARLANGPTWSRTIAFTGT